MEVILIEKVERLGKLGDIVQVKNGYAKNFLLPQGKAIRASKDNLKKFDNEKKNIEEQNSKTKIEAEEICKTLEGTEITIIRSASETGQLYGSVSKRDISNLINDLGHKVEHNQIILEKTIKDLGLLSINLKLHPEVFVEIKLNIARSEEEALSQLQKDTSQNEPKNIIESENIISDVKDKDDLNKIVDDNKTKDLAE